MARRIKVGIGLPATIPGVTGSRILEWAREADAGPFSSVAVIDRVVYANFEPMVTLAAAAAMTKRVRLMTAIAIAPLRNAGLFAKEAASVDALSGARLTLGLAVGGRADDFAAGPAPFKGRGKRFEEQLALMKRIWEQKPFAEGQGKVGPAPARAGGPELLIGGFSPAALARVGRFGDGFIAGGGGPDMAKQAFAAAEESWKRHGRPGKPRFVGLAYFGLGNLGDRPAAYIKDYYGFMGPMADMIAKGVLRTPDALKGALQAFEGIGMDELVLFPTVTNLDQVRALAQTIG